MKNFTLLASVSLLLFTTVESNAQKQTSQGRETKNQTQQTVRCGTMEALEQRLQSDPEYKARYEQGLRDFQRSLENLPAGTQRTTTLTAPVTIPVVVHIVLPNPNIVTDADVQYFLDRLNRDFSGFNADSANGVLFYGVRGHSLLRFAMARRDPSGNLTNGIERRVGAGAIGFGEPQAIKSAASGGLNPWPFQQYYNLWVGVGAGGLLGIAPEIGVGTAASDGVCVDFSAFANNPCFTIPQFNLGRTAVHEVGHNFGLYHTFQGGCGNADFQQLTTATQQLPAALLAPSDDTPGQSGATSGCPGGAAATGCAAFPTPPGKMYQNYMDYTDDACYSMYTKGQVDRMHYVLENFRAGYLTTQGHIPPAGAITLDALPLESVNPGGYELNGCTIINYPATLTCGGVFIPKFRVKNNGLTVITSVTVGYRLDNGAAQTVTVTGLNLPSGATTVVSLPAAASMSIGAHQFKFFTANPNAGADQVPANDTLTANLTIAAATALPVIQNFDATAFPPAPWTIFNPNGNFTWQRNTPGRNGSAGALYINNYANIGINQIDDFRSTTLATTGTDSVLINFDVAHKYYGTSGADWDTLTVLVSTDCGATFSPVFKKWGPSLAGAPGGVPNPAYQSQAAYNAPAAGDWRTERIAIGGALLTSGQVIVAFRNTNRFGNNIWIDNINIEKKFDRDLRVMSIVSPAGTLCANSFIPRVQVKNNGTEIINSFTLNYTIDGVAGTPVNVTAALAVGATITIALPATNATTGNHTFATSVSAIVFASGLAEQDLTNNTLSTPFNVISLNTTLSESFEGAFVPAGWALINPNNNNTWVRRAPGRNSGFSAFIDNYNIDFTGQIDELRAPAVQTQGVDSIVFTFDLAHKLYNGGAVFHDTLSILASTDCGVTFTAVYRKWGTALATAGQSGVAYVNPIATDWRTERIAIGGSFVASGSVVFKIRNSARFGNNIFIDNVNVSQIFKRDLRLVSINNPLPIICVSTTTPSVTVQNEGTEVVTALKVAYSIDGGALQTTTVTGLTLARNALTNVALPQSTVGLGAHTIRVYTFDPVTASGTGDQNPVNDTLTKAFSLSGTVDAPLTEGFEGTTFPPANWSLANPDAGMTWQRATTGRIGVGSAYLNNFAYSGAAQQRDDLATPIVKYSGVDSVRLSFDLSAVTRQYPGSTLLPLDTLEVLITRDCGNTFTTIYKKWGKDLQTINDPNHSQNYPYIPNADNKWRTEIIDLTAYANSPSLQVYFRNTTNKGNNIFIDNVNLSTRTLPARLKQQGYLVLPTVTQNQFSIWHYQTPSTLRFVTIYTSAGHLVYKKEYNGNAQRVITVDLSGQPAGTYIVKIGYEDEFRDVSERVIKQ